MRRLNVGISAAGIFNILTGAIFAHRRIERKSGLEGFTRYIASLGGRHNIRANCVRPGQILTRRLTTAAGEHVFARHFEMWQLIKGPGYAEDVANAMLFLASDEARFITAEMVNIDGGAAAKL
jgi:NAD(P)-dependent dehydrogenase (short-subunit alcohol dehydrogenase family)